jgi:hypothetical protein
LKPYDLNLFLSIVNVKAVEDATVYVTGAIWVAICTLSVLSFQTSDIFVVLPLIGTPVP